MRFLIASGLNLAIFRAPVFRHTFPTCVLIPRLEKRRESRPPFTEISRFRGSRWCRTIEIKIRSIRDKTSFVAGNNLDDEFFLFLFLLTQIPKRNLISWFIFPVLFNSRKYFTNCTKVVTNYRDIYFINAKATNKFREMNIYIYTHVHTVETPVSELIRR